MRHHMREMLVCLLVGMVCLLVPGQASAGDGWYMGMDLGVAIAPGLDMHGTDNDYPTKCDKFINPDGVQTTQGAAPGSNPTDCSVTPEPSSWTNELDGGLGVLAGMAVGYQWRNVRGYPWGNFRVEGEYFYRSATYDNGSRPSFGDAVTNEKLRQEIDLSEDAVDDVLSHNFFANLYWDYVSGSKFTPYLGFGLGFAQVSLDYFSVFKRNSDPGAITTFKGDVEGSDQDIDTTNVALDTDLAGTTTIGRAKLSDVVFGYQAIAGVDYQVSEPVTIGLKFRWADYGEFEGGEEWDQLRSHASTNSPDASDPQSARVRYSIMTDDIKFWGVSLNLKYRF